MQPIILLVFVLSFIQVRATEEPNLDSLLSNRHFFQLQRTLRQAQYAHLPAHRRLYYEAILDNFFHNLAGSNKAITTLLEKHKHQLSKDQITNLLMKKIDNHVKLYQYKQAYATTRLLLSKYRSSLTAEERADARNSAIIWKGLQQVPPQSTVVTADTRIDYRRDVAGLINIPVRFADSTYDFVFDTGANLSVINESYARKTKLKLINVFFKVRAITGLQVKANLAIAPEFRMGDIIIRNAVFMVFPDSALSFAQGRYAINGIIGFPVIEQLQEVHINKNAMTVPQTAADRAIRNFGVDELLPVISVGFNTDTLPFTFDTGAQFTMLNAPFYTKYKALVDTAGEAFTMQIGGAGGITKIKAFRLPQLHFTVANQPVAIKEVAVKTGSATPKDRLYYGNLGQDVMNQFREMIINFRYMYVDFVP
jgi:Predicted aspartyl protease